MGRYDGDDYSEEVYLKRRVDRLQAENKRLEAELADARGRTEEGYPAKWHQALGKIAEIVGAEDGASLADDIPQAVEKSVEKSAQNLLLLIELRQAAGHYWERAKQPYPIEHAAHERLWSVMQKVREAIGPLGEEQNDERSGLGGGP
jgi:hypothetical protein